MQGVRVSLTSFKIILNFGEFGGFGELESMAGHAIEFNCRDFQQITVEHCRFGPESRHAEKKKKQ